MAIQNDWLIVSVCEAGIENLSNPLPTLGNLD